MAACKTIFGWNRCDVCGRFIPMQDFVDKVATRWLVTPDSLYSSEEYETLCRDHREGQTNT